MLPALGAIAGAVPQILSFFKKKKPTQPTTPDPAVLKQLADLTAQIVQFQAALAEMQKKATTPEEVQQLNKRSWEQLCNLASQLPPSSIVDFVKYYNVACFGSTSVGKSSFINLLLGKENPDTQGSCKEEKKHAYEDGKCMHCEKAEVGRGETTQNITPYPGTHGSVCLWDFPGKNDVVSYYSTDVLSLAKAMSLCVVMYSATVKESWMYMELLTSMGSPFVVVLSKVDDWSAEELAQEKQAALALLGSKFATFKGWYSVSAKDRALGDTAALINLIASHGK